MKTTRTHRFRRVALVSIGLAFVLTTFLSLNAAFAYFESDASLVQAPNGPQAQVAEDSYSDNGLSCALPAGTPNYVADVVPEITQSSQFTSLANRMPYVYVSTDNMTNNFVIVGGSYENGVIIGGTTEQLSPMVELGFYTFGSATTCSDDKGGSAAAIEFMDVQVPVQNDELNITAATYHVSAPQL